MSDKKDPEVYTFAEIIEEAESESKERLKNGLEDGDFRVYFEKSDLTIQIERNGKKLYEIDLERCCNPNQLLDWIFQIHEKTWGESGGLLAMVLTILDDACHDVFGEDARTLFGEEAQTLFSEGEALSWK